MDLADIRGLEVFPAYESQTLEFKQTINASVKAKCILTICAFLNTKGGHIVFGVEDKGRRIIGINTYDIDNHLRWVDHIYHQSLILDSDDRQLFPGTVEGHLLEVRPGIHVFIITVAPTTGKKYKCSDGSVWYRLSASIFRVSDDSPQKEVRRMKIKNQRLYHELSTLKEDYKLLFGAAKEIDECSAKFTKAVETDILHRKKQQESKSYCDMKMFAGMIPLCFILALNSLRIY